MSEPTGTAPRRRLLAADVTVPVALALAWALLCWARLLPHLRSVSQSTGGEEGIYLWYLAHGPWSVLHAANPFVTDQINYPAGVNLVWNTSLLTPALLLAPVTELGGVLLTYNVALLLTTALSVLTAYAAFRRFVRWWPAALAGAALVAVSPYLVSQARGHLNLVLMAVPPLFLLVGDELLVRQRMRPVRLGLLLALLVVLQVGCSTEILASTAAVAALGTVVLALAHRRAVTRERVGYVARTLAVGVAASLVVLAVPAYYLFRGAQHLSGPAQASDRFRADLLSPVVPTPVQALAPASLTRVSARFPGNGFENTAYLGVTLIALVLVLAVVVRNRPVLRWAAVTALVSLVLSLGPRLSVDGHDTGVPLPFRALSALPLFSSGNAVRYSYYTLLLAALVVAVGCDAARDAVAARRAAGTRRPWLPAALATSGVVLAAVPLLPHVLPFRAGRFGVPAWFTSADGARALPQGTALVTYPYLNRFVSQPMTWQALADFRYRQIGAYAITPDPKTGKGRFDVPTATAYVETRIAAGITVPMGAKPVAAMRGEFAQWHLRRVVVDLTAGHAREAVAFYTAFLGEAPALTGGCAVFAVPPGGPVAGTAGG